MKFKKKHSRIIKILFIQFLIIFGFSTLIYNSFADTTPLEGKTLEYDDIDLIKTKQSEFSATTIPTQYDLRKSNPYGFTNHGNINLTVENQVGGTCWDYASLMSLQLYFAQTQNTSVYPKLSKAHLDYLASKYTGITGRNIGDGGNFGWDTIRYYYFNYGPITQDKCFYTYYNNTYYNDRVTVNSVSYVNQTEAKIKSAVEAMKKIKPNYYVHETIDFPGVSVKRDGNSAKMYYSANGGAVSASEMKEIRDSIKQHIMKYGGVYCSIRTHKYFIGDNLGYTKDGRYSQYDDGSITVSNVGNTEDTLGGHAITIIGWNDNYDKNKFYVKNSSGQIVRPTSNGAWLAVTNYGSGAFENGCQWISYEDFQVQSDIHGYLSANSTEKYNTYTFNSEAAYKAMKEKLQAVGAEGDITYTDSTKTIKGIDLIFNNKIKSLYFIKDQVTYSDLQAICKYELPKLESFTVNNCELTDISPITKFKNTLTSFEAKENKLKNLNSISSLTNLKSLSLQHNNIENLSGVDLSKIDTVNLSYQSISKTVRESEREVDYPNIFVEAQKSTSKIYSSSGFTFTGCFQKGDKTGVVVTSSTATIKINDGNAKGTTLTITRKVNEAPKIQMYYISNSGELQNGGTIDKNTQIRLVFSDDYGIAGYNITSTATQPTTWLTEYTQTPMSNVRIVNKTFSTVGDQYIWVKDDEGKVTKVLLKVKSDILLGDIDGNGTINLTDVLKLRRYIANSTKWSLTDEEKTRADVNKDEKINLSDVLKLRRYLAAQSNASIKTKHPDWLW